MNLNQIQSPADLKKLTPGEIASICGELRETIISAVTSNGGHLGSNLGAVELTVALHRTMDSPDDVVLWDTGHQAYVHKMLTGRVDDFSSLRKEGGLSGYPSREESDHDWIENSHASTALSYAHGLSVAFEATGQSHRRITAVIGDGSLTGGMAFEGLNNLGHSGRNVTIILNDNGRSYAPTVSKLSESLVKIRSNPTYMARQQKLEKLTSNLPVLGPLSEMGIRASKAAIREALEPQAFFEPLGVRYMGPFDGHNVEELEQAMRNAAEFNGPVVLHVLTSKGRGYAPAENDPIKQMHDVSEIAANSYTAGFSEALVKLGEEHDDLIAITAAMPDSTGLLPFRDRFPDRFLDVGIAEQHAMASATGMAMGGMRPLVALYSTFLTRAIDQVNLDIALHSQPVIICLDRAGITGDDGASHHGVLDLVLLSKIPNMTIFCPSSYQELQQMMIDAYAITTGPTAIRWPKGETPHVSEDQVGRGLQARKVKDGSRVCLIGIGKMLAAAEEAAELLQADGIDAAVWDPRVAKPIDPALLADAATYELVVTIEDGLRRGGIGSGISDLLHGTPARCEVLGVPTEFLPHAKPASILARLGLDGTGVATRVRELLT